MNIGNDDIQGEGCRSSHNGGGLRPSTPASRDPMKGKVNTFEGDDTN